jgi:hypothetical protein
MRGAAIVMTAMAIGRTLVARVGLAFIRTKLARCFCFAGTSVMPAFHVLHLELNLRTNLISGTSCKSTAISFVTYNSGPPLAIYPSD